MYLFNWFFDILNILGLSSKNAKILFLGVDNAGKTTLLHKLKDNKLAIHPPTIHPTMEELNIGKIKFKTFDVGGHEQARSVWKDYFTSVDAVVYIIDSSARERFRESKFEFDALMTQDELKDVPFVILGNKIDLPGAASPEEIKNAFGLHAMCTGQGPVNGDARPVELFMCSIKRSLGYNEAFQWLSQHIN